MAGSQTCQLLENDLMATCKGSKETKSNVIVMFLSQAFSYKYMYIILGRVCFPPCPFFLVRAHFTFYL